MQTFSRNGTAPQLASTAPPAPAFCAAAREIVTDPARYATRPIARRLAWMTLMAERGHTVNQRKLSQMQAGRV